MTNKSKLQQVCMEEPKYEYASSIRANLRLAKSPILPTLNCKNLYCKLLITAEADYTCQA